MTCSWADCDTKKSYANDVILTQLLRGRKTREFHEKVLQKMDDINLDDTSGLLESLERGRADNAKLEKANGGSVAAVGTAQGAKPKGGSKKYAGSQKGGCKAGWGQQDRPLPLLLQHCAQGQLSQAQREVLALESQVLQVWQTWAQ